MTIAVLLAGMLGSVVVALLPCTFSMPTASFAPLVAASLVGTESDWGAAHWYPFAGLAVLLAFAPREIPPPLALIPAAVAAVRLFLVKPTAAAMALLACSAYGVMQPNYLCFGCRSKQSEAKTNLALLFTAENTYFGVHGRYTSDLRALNWIPDGSPLYVYGFSPTCAEPGYASDTSDPRLVSASFSNAKMRAVDGRPLGPFDLPYSFATSTSFRAVAVGDVDPDDESIELDVWAIDDRKQLVHLSDDCSP